MKIKIHPILKLALKLLLTGLALYFVIRKIDFGEMGEIFSSLRLSYLFGALLAFVCSKILSAFRLNRYLGSVEVRISERTNLKLYLLGMYYNLFLPGGIGGDGYKIWLLGKHYDVKTARIFWAVMMDRVIGVLLLFCMAVGFLYLAEPEGSYLKFAWLLVPLALVAAWVATRYLFSYLLKVFWIANLQSFFVQLFQLLSAWLILMSIGVAGQPAAYLLVFLVSSIIAVLPITIGGLGAREFTFMLGAQWLALDLNISIALSLLFYLLTAFTSVWGMMYSLGPGIRLED